MSLYAMHIRAFDRFQPAPDSGPVVIDPVA